MVRSAKEDLVQYRLDRRIEDIAPSDVVALNGELILVDLRDAAEFEAGHVPGAIRISIETIEQGWSGIDGRLPFVTVCRTGDMARHAAHLLRDRGREQIEHERPGHCASSRR